MRINKVYIIMFLLFTALVLFEYYAPKETDWSLSFSKEEKIPFGNYIVFELLPDVFPDAKIKVNQRSIYQFNDSIDFSKSSFIFNTETFKLEGVNMNKLLKIAAKGSKVFIAANFFSKKFSDTLNFKTDIWFDTYVNKDSKTVNFVNKQLKTKNGYIISKQPAGFYFSEFDSSQTVVLGTISKKHKKINYIKIPYGKGAFYLHTLPKAFTNYNILKRNNAEYAFKAFSYLKNKTIIWDENYKPGRKAKAQSGGGSPNILKHIRNAPALNYAYRLLWLIALLFFLVNAKRKQRAMPVVSPPENASLEFAGTLANLYLNNSNHSEILMKRYLYWTDFLREKYYLNMETIESENAAEIIATKTGAEEKCIKQIMKAYKNAQTTPFVSSDTLLKFNKFLEKFYKSRL